MALLQDRLIWLVVGIPLVAGVAVLLGGAELSERHHSHHDTYAISGVVSRTLMLVMVFMGVLGGVTGWLCRLGVFATDPVVPLSFFAAFEATVFVVFVAISRCQVMAYGDRMFVRPWFGRRKEVAYADITRMRRSPWLFNPQFDNLHVVTSGGQELRISGLLDINQMLVRIDRFDVLEG